MLFSREFTAGIRAGRITRTYRHWKRPQARLGGRYQLRPDGSIEVLRITRISLNEVRDAEARAAGFGDSGNLIDYLKVPAPTTIYQVDFRYLPGVVPAEPDREPLRKAALAELKDRLERMDHRSVRAWTHAVLRAIGDSPGVRAGDLAAGLDWDTPTFKRQVRKLKALGLTISLETGYRLSPRGEQLLREGPTP